MNNLVNTEERIKALREEIIKHDLTYDEGKPTISDTEYDRLYYQLVDLERKYPEYQTEDSPTKRIYSKVLDGLKKVTHSEPMLSQEKAHTEEELDKFLTKVNGETLVQLKEDGLTIVLKYDKGRLLQGATRGDGYIGEDVTHTIMNIFNIPLFIDFEGYLELRAEAYIPFDDFKRVNTDGRYRSPRNLVSGSVRTLSAQTARERGVQLSVFDVIKIEGFDFDKDTERLAFIKKLGFPVVETKVFSVNQLEDLKKYILNYNETIRPTLDHMIDGLVLKINDLEKREDLGYTSKYPRWAIAFKFDSLDATTKIRDVIWTVGTTGQLTPNAVLDPVEIDNVLVSKASLANIDNIRKRDIRIGDTVIVARANDVIPQVVSSVNELRNGIEKEVSIPTHCPDCNNPVIVDGWKASCINPSCPAQIKRRLEVFVSRSGLNIDGLGEKTIGRLFDSGIIEGYTDIFNIKLKADQILGLKGFGKKGVEKMINGIEESKKTSLSRLLFSLSIPNCGEGTSKRIAEEFGTMSNIMSLDRDELRNRLIDIDDIGSVVADSFVDFFINRDNRKIISTLLEIGFEAKEEVVETIKTEAMSNKVFVITGKLTTGSRSEIKKRIEEKGGKVSSDVSKSTDYLVLGGYNHHNGEGLNLTSGKSKKATELNIEIISEEQLLEMIG